MSLIIKMDSIKTPEHLSKGINYIMQEWKTQGMVYSNSGVTPEEVHNTFLLTKELHPSHGTREGYHFKFSFSKDEDISKEDALSFIREWTEKYLGDEYDSVMSVHHDRDHTHMHLIFNSVKRDGGKYRYEKGDWEKVVKPLTNELCEKYHTGYLKEKDKALDYTPAKNLWGIVMQDMEKCINESQSYQDFKKRMVNDYHYSLREGVSKKHGVYLSLTPPGKAKAVRTYMLKEGFMPADIERKIEKRLLRSGERTEEDVKKREMDMEKQMFRVFYRRGNRYHDDYYSSRIPYQNLSVYQKHYVRQMLEARNLYRRTGTTLKMHEQSIHAIYDMEKDARLVCEFGVKNREELSIVVLALQKEEAVGKHNVDKEPEERRARAKEKLEKLNVTIKELKKIEKNEKAKEQEKEQNQEQTKERKDVIRE